MRIPLRWTYDATIEAFYCVLVDDAPVTQDVRSHGVIVDLGIDGTPVGIEVIGGDENTAATIADVDQFAAAAWSSARRNGRIKTTVTTGTVKIFDDDAEAYDVVTDTLAATS